MLRWQTGVGQAQFGKQLGVEAFFNCTNGHVFALPRGIGAVPGRATVQDIAAALFTPIARGKQAPKHAAQLG